MSLTLAKGIQSCTCVANGFAFLESCFRSSLHDGFLQISTKSSNAISSHRRETCFTNLSQDERVYGELCVARCTIFRWCQSYEAGRVNIKDTPRPGQAHVVTNSATISAMDELIRQNHRITTREIAVELSISKGTLHHKIHKKLGYGKVFTQWVPKHLSENQKTARWVRGPSATQEFLHWRHPLSFYALGSMYQCQWRLFIVVLLHMSWN
ncbi:hypothetical protein AVEN_138648-1 [Araneus ventricosus]|uniref:Mos1 transposase HTH domain-containing protein n=1 Tax=Araneus ventricosus TaxID=182803 RepID=A0A4Y2E3Z8_ARAVE|nr:hypothetical protein AVEN_138648-1 [Araneus ventricosus]